MPQDTDPTLSDDSDGIGTAGGAELDLGDDADAGTLARVTARLVRLDLDAATFELITAALTADVCDQVDIPTAPPRQTP